MANDTDIKPDAPPKTATSVLTRDENGKLGVVPSAEAVANPKAKTKIIQDTEGNFHHVPETIGPSGAVRQSFFEDDEGENLTSGTIRLDGQIVRVRELTAAEMAAYSAGQRELAEMMRELSEIKDAAAAAVKSDAITERQTALYDAVIGSAVADWELKRPDGVPVPCTFESKRKLRISKKAELSDKILQRSAIGRDLADFLGE